MGKNRYFWYSILFGGFFTFTGSIQLNVLTVSQRVVFKTVLMVWKSIHGLAPAYPSDLCILATAIRLVESSCALHPVESY